MMPARDSVKTVAALHAIGDGPSGSTSLRVVVATLAGNEPLVTQTRAFATPEADGGGGGGDAGLSAFLEQAGVDLLIRIIPAPMTVARVTTLPEMEGDAQPPATTAAAMAEALGLIAESELPAALPAHRRAAGVIRPGRAVGGPAKSVGLISGWPERDEDTTAWRRTWAGPQVGVSEIAALASLAQAVGGVERAMVADAASGGVGIVCAGPVKVVVRVAKLTASGESAAAVRDFESAAALALEETARAAESPGTGSPAGTRFLLSPEPSTPRLGGAIRDKAWLNTYGIAFGAITLLADAAPTTHGLVALHLLEPKTRPPVLARVSGFFGKPLRAGVAIAACLAVVMGLPLGVALARVRMLEKQVTDEPALLARNDAAERELAFYKLLREKRWPMTKLLADVSGAAPVGVLVETIEIGQGEGLTVRGKANSSDLVTTFRENLGKTKVFTQVTTPSTSPNADGVQFQLTAKVPPGAAVFPAKPIEDFAAKTLAERLYGEAARGHTPSRGERSSASRPDRADRGDRGSRGRSTNGASSSSSGSASSQNIGPNAWPDRPRTPTPAAAKTDVAVIPPPLTDADLAAMTRATAMLEFGKRKKAATQSGLDDATRRRLTEESEKAKARMQALMAQEGSK